MDVKKNRLPKNIESMLFDMDGVVLDSMPYHVKAWKDAFACKGMDVDERLFYLYEGAIEPEAACRLFADNGTQLSVQDFFEIHGLQKRYFIERYSHLVRPFEGAAELVEWLRSKGVRTALVTSSHREIIEAVLPRELERLFNHVVTGDGVKRRKPHPDPYLAGMKGIGARGGNGNVAVENAPAGIESAKKAGLECIALTTTLEPAQLSGADLIVHSHQDILRLLRNSYGET